MLQSENVVSAILSEFGSLKQEVRERAQDQAAVIVLNLTVIGAIPTVYFAAADVAVDLPIILFLIPVISSVLGMRYIDHKISIDNLGRFIQWQLKSQLASVLEFKSLVDYEVFAYTFINHKGIRLLVSWIPIAMLFVVLPAIGGLFFPFYIVYTAAAKKDVYLDLPYLPFMLKGVDLTFVLSAVVAGIFLIIFLWVWFQANRKAKPMLQSIKKDRI